MARPKIKIDFELVKKLANIQCTQSEIAAIIGCSVDTLQRNKDFAVAYKNGQEAGKMSLRRKQFALADKSAAMAIFLGKQYLGQKDQLETWNTNNNTVQILDDIPKATTEQIEAMYLKATKQNEVEEVPDAR